MGQELLTWEASEYEHRERGPDWFWAVGIVGIGLVVTTVILGNVLFAVLLVVAVGALLLQALKRPRVISFGVGERGVRVENTLYPYSTLESFWVKDDAPPQLLVKSEKPFAPLLIIPLGDNDPAVVREILLELVAEEELWEPLTQRVLEYLGF